MKENLDFKPCCYCKYSKHKGHKGRDVRCFNVAAQRGLDPVTGKPKWASAYEMRNNPKFCGPTGRLFELPDTPIKDKFSAFMLGLEYRIGRVASLPGRAGHRLALRWRKAREAWRSVNDNVARESDTPEPLPAPTPEDGPKVPDPSPLPQTEGAGKMALAIVGALALWIMAGVIQHDASATPSLKTEAAPCSWQDARRRKATCCYRWHDGTTRCFDCSDTA